MKKENKKLILVLFVSVGIMFILILLNKIDFNVDMSDWFGGDNSKETKKIYLYEPDYEADIYQNESYMSKNRYITYIESPFSGIITETNNEYGEIGSFFLNYFKILTDGNADAYNDLFTEQYFEDKNNKFYDRFTMQKIYDMEVEKLSEILIEDGSEYDGWVRYTFKVSYKIMANDGTFRSDMPSDTAVPQIFELLYNGVELKINSIIKPQSVNK